MLTRFLVAAGLLSLTQGVHYPLGEDSTRADWGYDESNGPDTWPDSFPEFCAGTSQSPIDLASASAVLMDPGDITMIGYDTAQAGTVTNNGHSLAFTFDGGIAPYIMGGRLPVGESFEFAQLHWHWGSDSSQGSEHTMDGKKYPIEIHLVHWNKKYSSIDVAVGYSDGLAVLGVFYEISTADNGNLKDILSVASQARRAQVKARKMRNNKNSKGRAVGDGVALPADLRLSQMIPSDRTEYYYYQGSLTTPTCNEVVLWTNFVSTVGISESQLDVFRALVDSSGDSFNNNYRPPQPLNSRTLFKRSSTSTTDVAASSMQAGMAVGAVLGAGVILAFMGIIQPLLQPARARARALQLSLAPPQPQSQALAYGQNQLHQGQQTWGGF